MAFLAVTNKDLEKLEVLNQANFNIDLINCHTAEGWMRGGWRSYKGKVTLFEHALETADAKTLEFLAKNSQGTDIIHKPLLSGKTPIEYAITTPNREVVETLISLGAKIKASIDNLCVAAKNGYLAIVNERLLDREMDINGTSNGKKL